MSEELQKPDPEWLESQFFSQVNEVTKLYAIIDGQWCSDIYGRLETYKDELTWTGLIAGEQAKELALTSPYLIRLEKGHKLTKWLLDEGWGQGWGIYFHANTQYLEAFRKPPPEPHKNQLARSAFVEAPGIEEDDANDVILLRRHFRKYQRVEFEDDGRLVRFRFFDPAVLRIYLLTCNPKEIEQFFGPAIAYFISEDYCEEPGLSNTHNIYYYYRPEHGELIIKKYNWFTKQAEQIDQLSASKEEAEFPNISIIPQIRNGQIEVFEKMQMEIFREKVTAYLIEIEGGRQDKKQEIKDFASRKLEEAKTIGLRSELDLLNYTICAKKYSDPILPHLKEKMQEGTNISAYLSEISER